MNISDSGKMTLGPDGKRLSSWKGAWPALILGVLALAACYPVPYRTVEPSEPTVIRETPIAPLTQLYFYPKEDQSTEQQSRDHYECYNWAVKQTGFDPGQSEIPNNQRVRIVPMPPPGHDTATLAIAGAVLGALIGGPRHAVEGALIGGSSGAIAGAASDSARLDRPDSKRKPTPPQETGQETRNWTRRPAIFGGQCPPAWKEEGYSVR